MAETAIKTAPGVLAVKADYDLGQVVVGTRRGTPVSEGEMLQALESIGYHGEVVPRPDS